LTFSISIVITSAFLPKFKTIQNKGLQKLFYKENNLPTSDFKIHASLKSIEEDLLANKLTYPFIWKSAQFGYDGKGVKVVENNDQLKKLPNIECIVEEKIKIQKGLSIIFLGMNQMKNQIFQLLKWNLINNPI
jgi:phosphoribosylaminoimidazole carboxylase (NCAIR synthetase)